jgi:hypothetical protein
MSEAKTVVSDDQSKGSTETQEEFVARKAYEEVTNDMHKFKRQAKEAEAAKAEYEAKLRAMEEERLRENEQWKELAEKRAQELEAVQSEIKNKDERFNTAVKKAALKQELGTSVRDEYLSFADVNAIEIDENGSLNMDSLRAVANKFREEHGSLIPPARPESTSKAAPTGQTVSTPTQSINDLSDDQLKDLIRSAPFGASKGA